MIHPGGLSFWGSIAAYFKGVAGGISSTVRALRTALPYLFNVRSGDLKKEVTEQYPDPVSSRIAEELPARSRGLLYNDIEKCTGCRDCTKICPVQCITVETEPSANPTKVWVAVFDIDFARCTFCGLCVEVCQPQSLVHTRKFESSVYSLSGLVASFGRGRVTPEQRKKWAKARQLNSGEDSL